MSSYHAERTVQVWVERTKTLVTVAKYHARLRVARRLGWRPGVTHSKTVGEIRYVFSDGCTSGLPCLSSTEVKR